MTRQADNREKCGVLVSDRTSDFHIVSPIADFIISCLIKTLPNSAQLIAGLLIGVHLR